MSSGGIFSRRVAPIQSGVAPATAAPWGESTSGLASVASAANVTSDNVHAQNVAPVPAAVGIFGGRSTAGGSAFGFGGGRMAMGLAGEQDASRATGSAATSVWAAPAAASQLPSTSSSSYGGAGTSIERLSNPYEMQQGNGPAEPFAARPRRGGYVPGMGRGAVVSDPQQAYHHAPLRANAAGGGTVASAVPYPHQVAPVATGPPFTIFVRDLPDNVAPADVHAHFAAFGALLRIEPLPHLHGANVLFNTRAAAAAAKSHGRVLNGAPLRIAWYDENRRFGGGAAVPGGLAPGNGRGVGNSNTPSDSRAGVDVQPAPQLGQRAPQLSAAAEDPAKVLPPLRAPAAVPASKLMWRPPAPAPAPVQLQPPPAAAAPAAVGAGLGRPGLRIGVPRGLQLEAQHDRAPPQPPLAISAASHRRGPRDDGDEPEGDDALGDGHEGDSGAADDDDGAYGAEGDAEEYGVEGDGDEDDALEDDGGGDGDGDGVHAGYSLDSNADGAADAAVAPQPRHAPAAAADAALGVRSVWGGGAAPASVESAPAASEAPPQLAGPRLRRPQVTQAAGTTDTTDPAQARSARFAVPPSAAASAGSSGGGGEDDLRAAAMRAMRAARFKDSIAAAPAATAPADATGDMTSPSPSPEPSEVAPHFKRPPVAAAAIAVSSMDDAGDDGAPITAGDGDGLVGACSTKCPADEVAQRIRFTEVWAFERPEPPSKGTRGVAELAVKVSDGDVGQEDVATSVGCE